MTSNSEVTIRVVLDTTQAEKALKNLGKQSEKEGDKASKGIGKALATGMGMYAGLAMAKSAATTPVAQGFGAVVSETILPYAYRFEDFIFQGAQVDARASQTARDQLMSNFAVDIHKRGLTPSHWSYFNQARSFAMMQEQGRQVVMTNTAAYGGVDFAKVFDRLAEAFTKAMRAGVDYLWNKIRGKE